MRTIWKQPLELTAHQVIRTPGRSGLLCAKEQEGQIVVWFETHPGDAPKNMLEWEIFIYGTGHEIHDMRKPIKYLDTVMVGKLVWHVYYWVYPKLIEVVAHE